MKLINCTTLLLETENNWPSGRPPYAILSHTWATDGSEVTYADYLSGRSASAHKNWAKIDAAVNITKLGKEKLNYLWIDTCCIDKESSSELTESINSMFAWYAQAVVCYAQIADFECGPRNAMGSVEMDENAAYRLGKCRWFYRGWTLQELIAPSYVEFFDKSWSHFGNRDGLAYLISMITGIDQDILARTAKPGGVEQTAQQALRKMTVAKKMSWAAERATSRLEDIAYSLLGIFEVSIPMLYGEGEIAFTRLQEEILKDSNDMTLFAWTSPADDTQTHSGILARSPKDFASAGTLICSQDAKFNPDYAITNKGLRISTRLRKIGMTSALFLNLNCHRANADDSSQHPLGISLQYQGAGRYVRLEPSKLIVEPTGAWVPERIIFISKTGDGVDASPQVLDEKLKAQSFGFVFKGKEYFDRVAVSHEDLWYEPNESFVLSGLDSFAGCLTLRTQGKCGENKNDFVVACGGSPADPWVCVAKHSSPVYSAALAQDWEKMAAAAKRAGAQGRSAKWVDTRHSNTAEFEGLEVAVKVEKVVAGVRIEVWGKRYDDASGCDTCCAECCCPKTGQTGCCCVFTD